MHCFPCSAPARVVAVRLARTHPELAPASRDHLAWLYGTLAETVLLPAAGDPVLLEPVAAGGPDVLAQVRYAVEHELAVTVEDVLRRRTTLAVRGLGAAAEPRVAHFLA